MSDFLIPFCVIRTDYKVPFWCFWTSTHILRLYMLKQKVASSELILRPEQTCFSALLWKYLLQLFILYFLLRESHVSHTFTKSATRDPIMKLISSFSSFAAVFASFSLSIMRAKRFALPIKDANIPPGVGDLVLGTFEMPIRVIGVGFDVRSSYFDIVSLMYCKKDVDVIGMQWPL